MNTIVPVHHFAFSKYFPVSLRQRLSIGCATTALLLATVAANAAGTTTWSGAGADQNWSTASNWSTVGGTTPPGSGDAIIFRSTGAAAAAGTVNSIVDAGFTAAPGSLLISNETATTFHTIQIATGNTLTVSGAIYVGGTNNATTETFTGGGTLRAGSGTSTFTLATFNNGTAVTLDLSGLNNFIYNSGGGGGTFNLGLDLGFNSAGNLKLAAVSNNVTATTINIGNNNNGGTSVLNLGAGTNIINATTVEIGDNKSSGSMQFLTGTGSLRLRNAAGTGRTTMRLAGNPSHSGSSSATTIATVSLKGHYVDMLLGTLTLADRGARAGGSDNAFFTFDTGIVDCTNINMNINTSGGTAPTALMSVGGGTLKVANSISLANCAGTAGTGTLLITNGGTVNAGSVIKTTTAGTGIISITNGTLAITSGSGMIGLSSTPIDTLNLNNATLRLNLDANSIANTSVTATTINTNGANTLGIASIANASGTVTFSLIAYGSSADPFGSFVVGTTTNLTLPLGYSGFLWDDTANQQMKLTVTAPTSYSLIWAGVTNSVLVSNWDTNKTANWVDANNTSLTHVYSDPDSVQFDDTASTNMVTLLTTNYPASVAVNNNSLNYVFNGPGKISGSTGLTKQGAATLMLADSGADDFTGNITLSGGTLILDQTNSALTGALTINGGTTAQIGNNDGGGALPSGTLDNEGTLVFQRANNMTISTAIPGGGALTQNGNGKLTLTGVNTYSGGTIASKGTLALGGTGSIAASAGLLVSNATFDVSGMTGTATATLNDLNITNAVINVGATNLQPAISVNSFEVDGILAKSNVINVLALPAVASYPATITLIKSANPITLTGGNFNFILGSLPVGTPAYAGSLGESADSTAIQLTLTAGPTGARSAVVWAGVAGVSATTNWSDRLNWQLPGAPVSTDNAFFDSSTTVGSATTVNNVLDASFTVAGLTYNNTNSQYQVTQIPANTTLTVNNTFTVGNVTADNAVTHAAFVDAGTLVVNASNGNLVGNAGSSGSAANASLDLSGLSNFVYNASAATFGIGNIGSRGIGSITLAGASNNITAATVAIETSSGSSSVSATSTLGAGTNIINASTINVAATRASGTLRFDPANPSGGLRLRGTAGTDSSRSTITLGNRSSGGSSGTATGTLALNDHPVDLKIATLILGQCNQASPVAGVGTLQFNQGIVDATGINLAICSGTGSATGNLTVGGGTLIVGSGGISLVNQTAGASTGNLTLSTTTVICSNSIVKTSAAGTANVSITDSTLKLTAGTLGTLAAPIDSLTLSDNGSLDNKIQMSVIVGQTNIAATSISASGTTTLDIASFTGLTGTTQIPLIYYGSGDPYANVALGSVPVGYTIGNGGALIDDTANQTIDILVTPPAPIVWNGAVGSAFNGNWDTSTLDWLNGSTPVAYADADYVLFNDAASNNVVTLTTAVSPNGVNVNNSTLNYTFTGSGKISGSVGLVKQGTGTLILDNSGTNDFTGGVNLAGGTLQIGNNDTAGNLPAIGNVLDSGTLVLNRTDSNTIANVISGTGNVTQNGTGTNKLAAVNTYNGVTLISSGMIIATNATGGNSSIGSTAGACYLTNGGTLDVEFPTANLLSFTNTTDDGGKQFYIAGAGVGGNGVIVNNGTVNQQNTFQRITLTADATVGGPARWDMRTPNGHFQPILDMQGFTLTKTGSNQMSMVALVVTNGGNIIINSGTLSFETISSNNATHITVNAGGALGHFRQAATLFTAPITLNGGEIRDLNGTPGSTNDSPITLTANSFLNLNAGSADQVRLNGTITESGGSFGLIKTNGGSYSLSGVNTYSGTTLVQSGTLALADNGSIAQSKLISVSAGATFDASQRTDQTLTLDANQTLSGFGTVTGAVVTASGSTVAPGSVTSIGTLTFANNTTLGGTNLMKISAATNDVLSVNGALVLGGPLTVSTLSTPTAGSTFTLFKATGGISGSFTQTNLPAIPGLGWVTTNLANGILSVVATINPNPTNIIASISGNVFTLEWPADHTGWVLQAQTNALGAGLNPASGAWFNVPGSDAVNSINVTMDPSKGTVFYRLVLP